VREHRRNLVGPHDAAAGDVLGRVARDVGAVEQDLAARRRQELGQQVEAGGLAGPVGADQRVDRSPRNLEVHIADRDEALELLGQAARFENDVSWIHEEAASIAM
jgi:hypothetical protein